MTTMKILTMKNKPAIHIYTPTYEHALAAIKTGATIISINAPVLGLRGETSFLTWEQINELRKNQRITIYLRVNTVIHNQDLNTLEQILNKAAAIALDGIIYSDIAVLQQAKEMKIPLPLLLETETTITNIEMIRFWEQQGVTNFLLSRELSLEQISQMVERKRTLEHSENVQLSVQIHGPVGIFHTLRPILTNYTTYLQNEAGMASNLSNTHRDAVLIEEMRPEESYRLIEDARGTYVFSAYDISLYEYLPELISLGIDMFKIDIFETQSVESMVDVVTYYIEAIENIQAERFVMDIDYAQQLQARNQYPIRNQFIKTGAPQ